MPSYHKETLRATGLVLGGKVTGTLSINLFGMALSYWLFRFLRCLGHSTKPRASSQYNGQKHWILHES
jgi:hypothetical protein